MRTPVLPVLGAVLLFLAGAGHPGESAGGSDSGVAGAGGDGGMAGDRAAGRDLAMGRCRVCHGIDGLARLPVAPHIGGEAAAYVASQLRAFRDGSRRHEMMSVVAAGLTDRQIADLAAWYSGHEAVATLAGGTDPGGAPALCVSCHGSNGIAVAGNAPNLAGETGIYIVSQLKAFRSGKRVHEEMSRIADGLDDVDIRAAADWYSGIRLRILRKDPDGEPDTAG